MLSSIPDSFLFICNLCLKLRQKLGCILRDSSVASFHSHLVQNLRHIWEALSDTVPVAFAAYSKDILDFIHFIIPKGALALIQNEINYRIGIVLPILLNADTGQKKSCTYVAWSKIQGIVDPGCRPVIVPQHKVCQSPFIHSLRGNIFTLHQLCQGVQSLFILLCLYLIAKLNFQQIAVLFIFFGISLLLLSFHSFIKAAHIFPSIMLSRIHIIYFIFSYIPAQYACSCSPNPSCSFYCP